jgi:hypothetical protein
MCPPWKTSATDGRPAGALLYRMPPPLFRRYEPQHAAHPSWQGLLIREVLEPRRHVSGLDHEVCVGQWPRVFERGRGPVAERVEYRPVRVDVGLGWRFVEWSDLDETTVC